jgi:hypothetical protein
VRFSDEGDVMVEMSFGKQVAVLFILAIPIACIAWTVTHEEIFREPRDYCVGRSRSGLSLVERKFFYLFTCEYCFSHYVTVAFLVLTRYHLWLNDWRGYIISGFSLVFVANVYMSAFGELRLEIRQDRQEIATKEELAEIRRRRTGLPPSAH